MHWTDTILKLPEITIAVWTRHEEANMHDDENPRNMKNRTENQETYAQNTWTKTRTRRQRKTW